MSFPDATAMANAATAIQNAYLAFPFLATIFGVVAVVRLGPLVIRIFKRALGGG
jgi:hypothetical protein